MSKVKDAVSSFNNGFSCAQAVFSTYAPEFGLDRELALKVSGGLGAGMGRLGETCGAVTAALMIIGLKHGPTGAGDKEAKELNYKLLREFVAKFKARNESIICKELLGCDISTPEGMKRAKEEKLFTTVCPELVQDVAEILEEVMEF